MKPSAAGIMAEVKNLAVYVAILLAFMFAFSSRVTELKSEINHTVQVSCLSGQANPTYRKYNDFVETFVDQQQTAYRLNHAKGDNAKAAADDAYAKRAARDKITIPTPKQLQAQCAKPLLP